MKRWLVGGLIVAGAVIAVFVLVARTGPVPVRGLRPAGAPAFDSNGRLEGVRAIYSPDGSRLAVLSSAGLALAERGRRQPVTEPGANVVDAAWFPGGTAFLVAEGPVPTGTLGVVETNGTVRGNIPLTPAVGFGAGHGMTVAPGGRQAVVTAIDRSALGPERRHLVVVDLETGATRPLTEPGGPEEFSPAYVDADTVVFDEQAAPPALGAPAPRRVMAIDLPTSATEVLAADAAVAGVVGGGEAAAVAVVRAGAIVVLGDASETAGERGREVRIGRVPDDTTLVAVHPGGGEAVVREALVDAAGAQVTGLRRIRVDLVSR